MKTVRAQKHWVKWQTTELQQDLQHCHPRWPQEEKTVRHEIKRINKSKKSLGTDAWFYYDWVVLVVMVAAIATHFIYYKIDTNTARYVYTRILSIANLLVWLRLLKYVRPFPGIGTLVIILGGAIGDFVNWGFLFFLLFVPFSAAFWIIFGGISPKPVQGFEHTQRLLYSVFRMAVGDDFNLEGLTEADPVMSRILTVMYLTMTTIVTLNLLIALLSETFSRVYNNAVANTIMQRAIKVIDAERALSKKRKLDYQEHVKANCSPNTVKSEINTDNSLKGSDEFYSNLGNLKKVLDDRFAKAYGKDKMSDFDKIKHDVRDLEKSQTHLLQDLTVIKELMNELKGDKKTQSGSGKSEEPPLTKLVKFVQNEKDSEKRRGKSQERKEKDKRGKTDKSGKTNKRSAKNRSQGKPESGNHSRDTSIVPYGHFGENRNESEEDQAYENVGFHEDRTSTSSDWEKLSVDSLSL